METTTLDLVLEVEEIEQPVCPDCGSVVMIVGHCASCPTCGFSLCSL